MGGFGSSLKEDLALGLDGLTFFKPIFLERKLPFKNRLNGTIWLIWILTSTRFNVSMFSIIKTDGRTRERAGKQAGQRRSSLIPSFFFLFENWIALDDYKTGEEPPLLIWPFLATEGVNNAQTRNPKNLPFFVEVHFLSPHWESHSLSFWETNRVAQIHHHTHRTFPSEKESASRVSAEAWNKEKR